MTYADIAAAVHHYIDDCGWSWGITTKIINRWTQKQYTVYQLKRIYQ